MDSNANKEITLGSDEDECNVTESSDFPFWLYPMRRDMQEIIPGLFLGPYASAMKSKLEDLLKAGITHIICIRQSIEAKFIRPNFPQHFQYLVLEVADCPTENIIKHFKPTKEFIDDCLDNRGRVLVHGNGGISRSAAVVIAYVMVKGTMSYREAFAYVRNKRFCISLNEGFSQQLLEYEHIYRAELLFACQTSAQSGKRKRFDLEMDSEQTFPK
ncbi:serine/threonine/tyrosine-interacting protein B [Biomphalaria pfeifferi]|uniref:Serine/threonine/tyrosine-interacting protein B n=1 Tax=Biomphalaria pfeifferi TaxID=112525 RepID=A0AAD8ATY8_BIOPF|nr:serine/threonine/tyrosine-interacting protein B [Biomphalaria pfeifferi]